MDLYFTSGKVLRPLIFRQGRRPIAGFLAKLVTPAFFLAVVSFYLWCVWYAYFHILHGQIQLTTKDVASLIGALLVAVFPAAPAVFLYFVVAPLAYLFLGYRVVPSWKLAQERQMATYNKMTGEQQLAYLWKEYMERLRGGTPYAELIQQRAEIVKHLNPKGLAAFEQEESLAITQGQAAIRQRNRIYNQGFVTGYMMGQD